MRTYPTNSPEAAARIVALTLISDGHVPQKEWDVLDRLGASRALGLHPDGLRAVVHATCEDLLAANHAAAGPATCGLDSEAMDALLAEITDSALRIEVLRLCVAVVEADQHLADGEYLVLQAAARSWQVDPDRLQLDQLREVAHG